MSQPDIVKSIIAGTEFFDPTLPERLRYRGDIGFLALEGSGVGDYVRILGYRSLPDGERVPRVAHSVTELSEVPAADQTIDKQGKGVGWRLYRTPQAVAGLAERTMWLAAFSVEISLDPGSMLDMRRVEDYTWRGRAQLIARHAERMLGSRQQGLDTITDAIHRSYGDAKTILFNQPPRARLRELCRRVRQPVPSGFLLIRDASLTLHGEGFRAAL